LLSVFGQPFIDDREESFPSQPIPLTSSADNLHPSMGEQKSESAKAGLIVMNGIAVEAPYEHTIQPLLNLSHAPVDPLGSSASRETNLAFHLFAAASRIKFELLVLAAHRADMSEPKKSMISGFLSSRARRYSAANRR
jgi:hypothetical protein